ncbi:helix-turn-helix domain-containing protein [Actinomadura sp. HBU206391]|uniref:helix-turn-helix domain-containing protein n=1 Tax=Actinomadura sp. HBU206391 TaxID=2731692 RepID=UPI0016508D02|nr:helix-turn-helix domain-containing protein [Actinomadura sp. HBU206391]MBC6463142.1 AraC family transcriptional regulator [Actinomadura sp. HBU206391]
MTDPDIDGTRGILHTRTARENFTLVREAPAEALTPFVDYFWILDWDLRGRDPHRQQILTHPSVHLTFATDRQARITGIVTGLFTEQIEGVGRVVGVRFRPGGFRPFLGGPVSSITDRALPVTEVFGLAGRDLDDRVTAAAEPAEAIAAIEDFLVARAPEPDPALAEVAAAIERITTDPTILRVGELAALLDIGTRRLQRLFNDYVGAGPKWVIRRCRMHEAAHLADGGTDIDWAAIAADLGYADQAHFTRDFTATIGTSPAQYAKCCADGR